VAAVGIAVAVAIVCGLGPRPPTMRPYASS